ncbi:MAG TPA: hypothetical protein VIH14_00210 [Anaerolineales bacterium]
MSTYKDSIETLRLAVEGSQHSTARYKEKVFVRELHEGRVAWEGDVFSFELTYDSKKSGATKEQIADWRLPGPSAKGVQAAEQRGQKLRKQLESSHSLKPEIKRRAKLAYAWSTPVKGSDKRKINVVLQEGPVKSPASAVKATIEKDVQERQK